MERGKTVLLTSVAVLVGWGFVPSTCAETVVFRDGFENGDGGLVSTRADDAFDALDVPWYQDQNNTTVTVQDDAFSGAGSQRALQLHPNGSINTFRRIAGTFPAVTLGDRNGDRLVLRFDFRLHNGYAIANNTWGFRFGLYDGKTTPVAIDWTTFNNNPAVTDDTGYYVRLGTGTSASTGIVKEPAGDNPTGGTQAGTDITDAGMTAVAINNYAAHRAELTVERISATSLKLRLAVDGTVVATATDTGSVAPSGLVTRFTQVYFANGNVVHDVRVDNVTLTAIPVPRGTVVLLK